MLYDEIYNFYKEALKSNKFNDAFKAKLKNISDKDELKRFISEKVCPIAKSMGYNFTAEELLLYEEELGSRLSEEDLKSVSGGVSSKNLILSGIISLFAIGGGVFLSSDAHAMKPGVDAKLTSTATESNTDKKSDDESPNPTAMGLDEKSDDKGGDTVGSKAAAEKSVSAEDSVKESSSEMDVSTQDDEAIAKSREIMSKIFAYPSWFNCDFNSRMCNLKQCYKKIGLKDEVKEAVKDLPAATVVDKVDLIGSKKNPGEHKCVIAHDNGRFIDGTKLMVIFPEYYNMIMSASQFNLLESVGAYHSPLFKYGDDRTQGPTVCSLSLLGCLKREAQYYDKELGDLLSKRTRGLCGDSYEEGYLRPWGSEDKVKNLILHILKDPVKYGYQDVVADVQTREEFEKPFRQIFCSAVSYQGCYGKQPYESAISYVALKDQYMNALKDAINKARENPERQVALHVSCVGSGAFGNPSGIAQLAFVNAYRQLKDKIDGNLTIFLHGGESNWGSYNSSAAENVIKDLTTISEKSSDADKELLSKVIEELKVLKQVGIKTLTEKWENQDYKDAYYARLNPVEYAAKTGNLDVVRKALAEGKCQLDKEYYNEKNLFQLAVENHQVAVLEELMKHVEKDKDVNLFNTGHMAKGYSDTLLELAITKDYDDIVRVLLTSDGINVNSEIPTNFKAITPLHLAAICGNKNIMKMILQHKSFDKARYHELRNIDLSSDLEGAIKAVLRSEDLDVDEVDAMGNTILHKVASQKKPDSQKVRALIRLGANVLSENYNGETPLDLFKKNSKYSDYTSNEIFRMLQYGANYTLVADKPTPLHNILSSKLDEHEKLDEIKKILETESVNVNAIYGSDNLTALHTAAKKGYVEIIKTLIAHGADVNITSDYGTPLSVAIVDGCPNMLDVVKVLLDTGAKVNTVDQWGFTPLMRALGSQTADRDEVVNELLQRGANKEYALIEIIKYKYLNAEKYVSKFIDNMGADVNAQDGEALRRALLLEKNEVVDILLNTGKISDDVKVKILKFFMTNDRYDIIENLLENLNFNLDDSSTKVVLQGIFSKINSQVSNDSVKVVSTKQTYGYRMYDSLSYSSDEEDEEEDEEEKNQNIYEKILLLLKDKFGVEKIRNLLLELNINIDDYDDIADDFLIEIKR